jgi:ectoine hydroxylase-related dioxygenase (phytanoyl-CoA dioxygenase family)
MNELLGPEWDYYYGGLPVLPKASNILEEQHGFWHRDAYSLFNDELLDISLPPFYYTVLIPLQTLDENTGGCTEFILGSHKQTYTIIPSTKPKYSKENPITDEHELITYLEEFKKQYPEKSFSPNLNPGDVIIFSGYTIHRGLMSKITNTRRDMVYIVCKRKWYDDEPTSNYTLLETTTNT